MLCAKVIRCLSDRYEWRLHTIVSDDPSGSPVHLANPRRYVTMNKSQPSAVLFCLLT